MADLRDTGYDLKQNLAYSCRPWYNFCGPKQSLSKSGQPPLFFYERGSHWAIFALIIAYEGDVKAR